MNKDIKVKLRNQFDGKVSPLACNHFKKLCNMNIRMKELEKLLNNSYKQYQYFSEVGQRVFADGSSVEYSTAAYILVLLEGFTTDKGDSICAWMHRKSEGKFEALKIGTIVDFKINVAENNSYSIGALSFETLKEQQSFLKRYKELTNINVDIGDKEVIDDIKNIVSREIQKLDNKQHDSKERGNFKANTGKKTSNHRPIYIEGTYLKGPRKCVILKPSVKL